MLVPVLTPPSAAAGDLLRATEQTEKAVIAAVDGMTCSRAQIYTQGLWRQIHVSLQ